MNNNTHIIAENVSRVREAIAEAAITAGRNPVDVQLVAVSKYVGIADTVALLAAGCRTLGESRPQQLWEKAASPELAGASWHLVGHLQRNKVRKTLPVVELIHSVDSLRLIEAIEESAKELDQTVRILLEVNCSGEAAKHGLTADGVKQILPELGRFDRIEVQGLMTMAALDGDETVAARNFASLRELRDQICGDCPPNVRLDELSMGMSHDFRIAIREGATIVRVGSILFEGISP